MANMQNFLEQTRQDQAKRNTQDRIKDYDEIYEVFKDQQAQAQASRCVQCANPYCSSGNKPDLVDSGCPLGNHIPQWLQAIADDNIKLAFSLSNATSPFPEIMGKVCPVDKLCEKTCTLKAGLGSVTIGSNESYLNHKAFGQNLKPFFPKRKSSKTVGVIGSGPAGLSVATFLLKKGIGVEIFERDDAVGGLLTYGIPNFKLDKKDVMRRVGFLEEAGLKIHLNTQVGKDISFEQIQKQFDAVFVGIGATNGIFPKLDRLDGQGVYRAMEVLTSIQKAQYRNQTPVINLADKKVLVIGGGDTAMDCVRTAIREQAQEVRCLYRRGAENMPGSVKEYQNAVQEGVQFDFFVTPKRITTDDDNCVKGLTMLKTKIIDGKLHTTNEEQNYDADIIILALGFEMQEHDFVQKYIKTNTYGNVILDNYQTSTQGVFAGGDCYRGADLVVNAALDGREAAKAIAHYLGE